MCWLHMKSATYTFPSIRSYCEHFAKARKLWTGARRNHCILDSVFPPLTDNRHKCAQFFRLTTHQRKIGDKTFSVNKQAKKISTKDYRNNQWKLGLRIRFSILTFNILRTLITRVVFFCFRFDWYFELWMKLFSYSQN